MEISREEETAIAPLGVASPQSAESVSENEVELPVVTVVVTTHLYDGRKSLPLDIELYQHANSLAEGKQDPEFEKKPELATKLIDQTLNRGYQPGIVIVDAGYGNNTSFLLELEKRQLKYLGGLAKNRKVIVNEKEKISQIIRLDELAQALPQEAFAKVQLNLDKPKTLWVATKEVEISQLVGKRNIAIVMNAATFSQATDIDYFITGELLSDARRQERTRLSNVYSSIVTPQWIVDTYGSRNWVEVFYREALMLVRVKGISSPR